MSNCKYILIGGLAVLWYTVLRGVQALRIGLSSYALKAFDLINHTVTLSLDFTIKNPLLIGVTLKGIQGTITGTSLNKTEEIGKIDNVYDYYIGGLKTHIVRANVVVSTEGVLSALSNNINSGSIDNLVIQFDGYLIFGDIKQIKLPIKKTINISSLR